MASNGLYWVTIDVMWPSLRTIIACRGSPLLWMFATILSFPATIRTPYHGRSELIYDHGMSESWHQVANWQREEVSQQRAGPRVEAAALRYVRATWHGFPTPYTHPWTQVVEIQTLNKTMRPLRISRVTKELPVNLANKASTAQSPVVALVEAWPRMLKASHFREVNRGRKTARMREWIMMIVRTSALD